MKKIIFLVFGIALLINACQLKTNGLESLLENSEQLKAQIITPDSSNFNKSWLIMFQQPLDHANPEKGHFMQRIWLSHKDASAPTVMVTEGYSANRKYTSELAKLLNANQIIVEHRYFEESCPDSLDWQYLTVEQAANDHHRIIQYFKQHYKGKWLTTGISKGGQTSIYHRALFPNDVDVSVPYVAPINLSREDQRVFDFFHEVGTVEDRAKIHAFQKAVLEQREEILPMFESYATDKGYTFRMGVEQAFDLVVLEYPFSFWQWHGQLESIPQNTASTSDLFEHLKNKSDISYVADQSWDGMKPFFYQAYVELGYYAYVASEFDGLITSFEQDTISSCLFAPGGESLVFDESTMADVMKSLRNNQPEIMAIVGDDDPWGATALPEDEIPNTIVVRKIKGNHRTRINNLPKEQKDKVLSQLNEWINK
ncbi:S28 family serine protease [Carboxylicivirga sp. N1Y90]|uniref:S28 family serine protease n=1 Tax=Carboxylicivirga fragile TaxID=3417571 RepID=UPI003D32B3C1|nr:peptidase [Marinilabiliaceae bacterium N1Y90]